MWYQNNNNNKWTNQQNKNSQRTDGGYHWGMGWGMDKIGESGQLYIMMSGNYLFSGDQIVVHTGIKL